MKRRWHEFMTENSADCTGASRAIDGDDPACAPISKRINRLSLDACQNPANDDRFGCVNTQLSEPPLSAPVSVPPSSGASGYHTEDMTTRSTFSSYSRTPMAGSSIDQRLLAAPPGGIGHSLPAVPNLRPEDSPHYYNINCCLYRLHLERLKRSQC